MSIQKRYGILLPAMSPLTPWLVRHASWLLFRYAVGGDGLTGFQRVHNTTYHSKLLEIGEGVMGLNPSKDVPKYESRWSRGVWLGRAADSDEHIIGFPFGVY